MASTTSSFGLKKASNLNNKAGANNDPVNSQQKSIIEIYTDWANHYLDKIHGGRKKVKDLQNELQDGLILAEVIEAVMGSKVPEIYKKPKNNVQMVDNIQSCLNFLAKKGVAVHDIHASDIREGHLKAILGLFFQLSRYKQQQKQLAQERVQGTSTPKIPSVPPSPARGSGSGIPSPARTSGLQPPKAGSKLPGPSQRSMLEKLKSGGGRNIQYAPPPPPLREVKRGLGKRTSSSSGFSSARSIGSESSVSLSSDTNFPSPSALRRITEISTQCPPQRPPVSQQQVSKQQQTKAMNGPASPRVVQTAAKANSPRRSPKLQRAATEIKDYGPIDQNNYPPHHFSNLPKPAAANSNSAASKIPNKSGLKPPSKIPGSACSLSPSKSKSNNNNNKTSTDSSAEAMGCTVRPLKNEVNPTSASIASSNTAGAKNESVVTSENDESTAQMTASFHSRTKSLPRTKRREDGSPGPANVAVVSPMPVSTAAPPSTEAIENKSLVNVVASASSEVVNNKKKEEMVGNNTSSLAAAVGACAAAGSEDPLKGLVPLGPLGLFSSTRQVTTSNGLKPTHQLPFSGRTMEQLCSGTTLATNSVLTQGGSDGYMSDGDALNLKSSACINQYYPHHQHQHLPNSPPSQSSIDDGYLSEGGASFYARKIQSRIALEKQKTAEEQARKFEEVYDRTAASKRPLPGLPDVLGGNEPKMNSNNGGGDSGNPIYRVVGGRKHVQKSEAAMQTDTIKQSVQDHYDWKQAMAYNAKVLSSQEKAMDEYLRRQRANAEQHIHQMYQSPYSAAEAARHRAAAGTSKEIGSASGGFVRLQEPTTAKMPLTGVIPSSTPATPTGRRRNLPQSNHRNGSPSRQYHVLPHENYHSRQGGSLERGTTTRIKISGSGSNHTQTYAASDSEYGHYGGSGTARNSRSSCSPSSTRKYNQHTNGVVVAPGTSSPSNTSSPSSPNTCGSKSLPKGASSLNYGLMMDKIQQKRHQRQQIQQYTPKINDGSLSDSNYVTYDQTNSPHHRSSSPYSWLQPASTYAAMGKNSGGGGIETSSTNFHNRTLDELSSNAGGCTSDILGSNESLNSVSSSIQQARANSLTKARLMLHQQQHNRAKAGIISSSTTTGGNTTSTNASVAGTRSNVSEKSYSSLSTDRRTIEQDNDYYGIVPFRKPITSSNKNEYGVPSVLSEDHPGDNNSGIVPNQTDHEILKLRRELAIEHDRVLNLTSQLATNAHVVAAFEQSLANMTARLQQLTATSEKKDFELNELRRNIDLYKQCGIDAGLMKHENGAAIMRQNSTSEMVSDSGDEGGLSSTSSSKSKRSSGTPKRSGWLRNSFSKAFNKEGKGKKSSSGAIKSGSISDAGEESLQNSPKHQIHPQHTGNVQQQQARAASALSGHINNLMPGSPIKSSKSSDTIDGNSNPPSTELISELKRQLMEKDNLLTETRLEALSSAHQLESLRDTVTKMRNELMNVKSENEKLHSIQVHVSRKSLSSSSQNSLNNNGSDDLQIGAQGGTGSDRRNSSTLSESSIMSGPSSLDLSNTTDPTNREGGKLVPVIVLNTDKSFTRIGTISVSGRSKWDLLDSLVHRLFKEYVMRVDPTSNLGLSADSIAFYQAGEIKRHNNSRKPELLPYGYLVGDTTDIMISLRKSDANLDGLHVDALAFETLTPKAIIQRYVSLLLEHKRVVLSGPTGAGKTFMAHRIANFVVNKSKKSVATFAIQRNNVPELKDFLKRMCNTIENEDTGMNVIILDNLQHAGKLDEVFQDCTLPKNAFIIGTLNSQGQAAQTPTNLQLHHNFRFVQLTTHTEPLKGLVGRCLRQRLLNIETKTRMLDGEMSAAVDWVARIHVHLNRILESHASGDAIIAPAHFMDCPIGHEDGPEAQGDQVRRWFLQLWNEVLHQKILDSLREGIEMYGHRSNWEDPVQFLEDSWPWANSAPLELRKVSPEDVGYDCKKFPQQPETSNNAGGGITSSVSKLQRPSSTGTSVSSGSGTNTTTDSDPLFNMLLHLQEAANNELTANNTN